MKKRPKAMDIDVDFIQSPKLTKKEEKELDEFIRKRKLLFNKGKRTKK